MSINEITIEKNDSFRFIPKYVFNKNGKIVDYENETKYGNSYYFIETINHYKSTVIFLIKTKFYSSSNYITVKIDGSDREYLNHLYRKDVEETIEYIISFISNGLSVKDAISFIEL